MFEIRYYNDYKFLLIENKLGCYLKNLKDFNGKRVKSWHIERSTHLGYILDANELLPYVQNNYPELLL